MAITSSLTKGKGIKGFLTSETAVTVYSAVVATPIALGLASRLPKMPIPNWLFLALLGVVAFLISSQLKGYGSAIVTGVGLGIFLNAFFATNFGAMLSARLGVLTISG